MSLLAFGAWLLSVVAISISITSWRLGRAHRRWVNGCRIAEADDLDIAATIMLMAMQHIEDPAVAQAFEHSARALALHAMSARVRAGQIDVPEALQRLYDPP